MTDDADSDLAERRGLDSAVYGPAEDSALLATAAVEEVSETDLVFEVGVGSGWVADRVRAETGARVVGCDLVPEACRTARGRGVETVRANLLDPVADGAVDAVLFNPPYLPTAPDLDVDGPLEPALAGGPDGRAVVEPFLGDVGRVLAPDGRALLLVSTLTGLDAVRERANEAGLTAETVLDEEYPFERLVVLRLARKP